MNQESAKLGKKTDDRPMTDDEFEAAKQRWRDADLADVRI